MGKTAIGWTDETWNPVRGCTQISPGCANCYAKHQAARIVRMSKGKACKYDGLVRITKHGDPAWTGRVAFDPETLAAPLRWRTPRRVFVNSMSDLFHEELTNEQIAAVFGVMAACPQHTFQVLTKRSDRMRAWFCWLEDSVEDAAAEWSGRDCATDIHDARRDSLLEYLDETACAALAGHYDCCHLGLTTNAARTWPPRNIWPGVSVEDRKSGVPRIDDLRAVPAAVRMLSCEPLLEDLGTLDLTGIGWLIDGCESGEGARPAQPEWFASLEEQCRAAGVPYFHKQEMVDGKLVRDFPGRQEFPR